MRGPEEVKRLDKHTNAGNVELGAFTPAQDRPVMSLIIQERLPSVRANFFSSLGLPLLLCVVLPIVSKLFLSLEFLEERLMVSSGNLCCGADVIPSSPLKCKPSGSLALHDGQSL